MADIYKVNSENIIGGAGRLVFKAFDGTYPDSIEEVMSTTDPYDLVDGWQDLGATTEGITTSRGFDSDEFEIDQKLGAVDQDITAWNHTLETTLAENTVQNRQLALVGGEIIETPPTLGTSTALTAAASINATILSVASAANITAGSFIQVAEGANAETKKVSRVSGSTIYLETPLANAYTTTGSVRPITALGSRRIGYGTIQNIPQWTFALISQKKDGSLYMAVFKKCKVTGDDKEQVYEKGKRTIPLSLAAYPDDNSADSDNVFYEIEQLISTP